MPDNIIPRDYQERAVRDLRAALAEVNSAILYSPTGSGKTTIAADITRKAAEKQRAVLFVGDSQEIIEQSSATLDRWGVSHGIIMASHPKRAPWELVHVATIQTLRNRALPKKDLVFADEAHLCRSASWEKVLQHYLASGAKIIGLTATPARLDGRGLGKLFKRIVYCPSVEELTAAGWLVPFRIFAPSAPDLSGVHTQQGDFKKDELATVMDKKSLTGDIVTHWLKLANGRVTIVAAAGIEHSKHIRDQFRAAGIPAEHCDGTTDKAERRRILGGLKQRSPLVLCQVDICGKGWDEPAVSCAIDARPTQSLARWLQFVGRAGRISPGKSDAVLLDHAGNVARFGLPDEPREWTLEETLAAGRREADYKALSVRTCKQCWACYSSTKPACPYCGAEYEKQTRKIDQVDGTLREVSGRGVKWFRCDVCAKIENTAEDPAVHAGAGHICSQDRLYQGTFRPCAKPTHRDFVCSCGKKIEVPIDSDRKRCNRCNQRHLFDGWLQLERERRYKPGFAASRFRQIYKFAPPQEWFAAGAEAVQV